MSRLQPAVAIPLSALVVGLAGSAVGLAVNGLRPDGIPLVAPFPYQQDCPDKLAVPDGPTITAEEAARLVGAKGVQFIDARPEDAFGAGHIIGAQSLPFSFIAPVSAETAAGLKKSKHLIVYCDSPGDKLAGLLAEQLVKRGLTVKVLKGGWDAYARVKRAGAGQ